MNERSEGTGLFVAVGVALMLFLLLLVGGGIAYFVFARQAAMARAEAAMARAAEMQARRQVEIAEQYAVAAEQSVQGKLAGQAPSPSSVDSTASAIESVLRAQEQAWNAGNIDQFMDHYWKSEDLTFSSGGQTTRGWNNTWKRYRERYPTPEKMGKLKFDSLEVTPLGDSAALVLGRWQVERESEPLNGNFSLVVRKTDDRWFIIHDHTSRLTE